MYLLESLSQLEHYSTYNTVGIMHSASAWVYQFASRLPYREDELDVNPFFCAIEDRDSRWNLVYNMFDLAHRLYSCGMTADGLCSPDNWQLVTTGLDVCVLFKGWFETIALTERKDGFVSRVRYQFGEFDVPGHQRDSMYQEVVLYACAVAMGLFDEQDLAPDVKGNYG